MIIENEPIQTQVPRMGCKFTCLGVFWAILSLLTGIITSVGYYMPYWLLGSYHDTIPVHFGSFRRCNYPMLTNQGSIEIIKECGRYTTFADIPSLSWQITTILVGVGAAASLLVCFIILAGCCLSDVITQNTSKVLGIIQLIAALFFIVGGAFYPFGWNSSEVKDACGGISDVYNIGTCQFSWSTYMLVSGTIILLICFLLSFKASKIRFNRPFNL